MCSIHLDDATGCSQHTSLLVERRQSDEANQCMGMIRRPWWSEANGRIWPGCQGNTPTLFRRTSWDFNDHRESGPWFNVSSEWRCFFTVKCPHYYTGVLVPTQTTGWATPAGLTNTSSSSNLVFFPGGLPSRYWPASFHFNIHLDLIFWNILNSCWWTCS